MRYTADNVLIKPEADGKDRELILSVTPQSAGWDYISFQARRLGVGAAWSFDTGENEFAFVNLSGRYRVESNRGTWAGIGGRADVSAAERTHFICRVGRV